MCRQPYIFKVFSNVKSCYYYSHLINSDEVSRLTCSILLDVLKKLYMHRNLHVTCFDARNI